MTVYTASNPANKMKSGARLAAIALASLALAGCGGGGGGGSVDNSGGGNGGNGGGGGAQTYESYDNRLAGLGDDFDMLMPTNAATLSRIAGDVQYSGVGGADVTLGNQDTIALLGEANVTVNFGNNMANGTLTNIVDENNGRYTGTVIFEPGLIDRSRADGFAIYVGDAGGTFTAPDGQVYEFIGAHAGGFLGTRGEAIFVSFGGEVVSDDLVGTVDGGALVESN